MLLIVQVCTGANWLDQHGVYVFLPSCSCGSQRQMDGRTDGWTGTHTHSHWATGSQIHLPPQTFWQVISRPARPRQAFLHLLCIVFRGTCSHLHACAQIAMAASQYAREVCFFRPASVTSWLCSFHYSVVHTLLWIQIRIAPAMSLWGLKLSTHSAFLSPWLAHA